MPTYDYVCDACGHAFEHLQSMTSSPLRVCPSCRKRKLRRLIGSGAGVIFKGGGFYETDYKRKGGGGAAASKDEAPASKDTAASKSEPGACTAHPASCAGPCTSSDD